MRASQPAQLSSPPLALAQLSPLPPLQVMEVMPPKSVIDARGWERVQDLGNFLRHMSNTEWRTCVPTLC
jgi:hypothetical protein